MLQLTTLPPSAAARAPFSPYSRAQRCAAGGDRGLRYIHRWVARGTKNGYKPGYFSLNGILPPVRKGVSLIKGLFNKTLAGFLEANPDSPLAWVNVDCDLYGGTRDVLALLGPCIRVGSRLHFHELMVGTRWNTIADPGHKIPDYPLSEEASALYEWLRYHPRAVLELLPVKSPMNTQAAAFVARSQL